MHSSLLQLLKRAASFDRLMLACIANEDDAILGAKTVQKITHLVGAGKARFIHEVQPPFRASWACWPRARKPCNVPAVNSGLLKLLRGA